MALFSECRRLCAQKLLDTAGIVREAIYQQLPAQNAERRSKDTSDCAKNERIERGEDEKAHG
jgi:hypothetical protein